MLTPTPVKRPSYEFLRMAWIYWTPHFGTNDISFGIHICWKGRIDIHFLFGMLSLGRVPIYRWPDKPEFAASNSFHESITKWRAKKSTGFPPSTPIRASVQPLNS